MTPPAVLITDAAEYQYRTYSTSTEAVQQHLAGTLIVAFDSAVGMVDVYFLDESGRESSDVIHVPLG
jgi:hypothetical protein